jgi:hypothetical protein
VVDGEMVRFGLFFFFNKEGDDCNLLFATSCRGLMLLEGVKSYIYTLTLTGQCSGAEPGIYFGWAGILSKSRPYKRISFINI